MRMLLRFVMGLAAANESERTGESDELGWELVSTTGAGRSARTPMRRSTAGDGVGDAGAPIRSGDGRVDMVVSTSGVMAFAVSPDRTVRRGAACGRVVTLR